MFTYLSFHVLQIECHQKIVIQAESRIPLRHLSIKNALVGLFGTVQAAAADTDIVLLTAPLPSADIDAARVQACVVDQLFVRAEGKTGPGTEDVA